MRLIERDTELYGKSPNARAFVLVTDGQAWSGEVARALKTARTNDVPVWVVGVGTTVGGFIPEPPRKAGDNTPVEPPIRASLDRATLAQIATAGGGEYLELDREGKGAETARPRLGGDRLAGPVRPDPVRRRPGPQAERSLRRRRAGPGPVRGRGGRPDPPPAPGLPGTRRAAGQAGG